MPNTYSWKVDCLDVAPVESGLSNVVKKASAFLVASDGAGFTAQQLLSIQMGDADPGSFTPFPSLTKEQVVGWIESALGAGTLDRLKEDLDSTVFDLANRVSVAPPWA